MHLCYGNGCIVCGNGVIDIAQVSSFWWCKVCTDILGDSWDGMGRQMHVGDWNLDFPPFLFCVWDLKELYPKFSVFLWSLLLSFYISQLLVVDLKWPPMAISWVFTCINFFITPEAGVFTFCTDAITNITHWWTSRGSWTRSYDYICNFQLSEPLKLRMWIHILSRHYDRQILETHEQNSNTKFIHQFGSSIKGRDQGYVTVFVNFQSIILYHPCS